MVPGTPPISQLERRQEVALSIEHMMTHLKKCPGCDVCVQAKMQAKQARRRDPDLKFLNEQPERFGQLLWADPVIIGKKKISRGITGEKVALFICDAASELCDFPALRAKTSELITIAVQYFLGDKRGEMLYSDGAEELRVSAERLGLVHRTSTPYRPQSNGRCEVRIRGVVQGTRCLLLQAGLPHRFWPLAGRAWCFGKNVTAGDEDASAFEHVHGYSFNGQLIPFGALVLYKLNPRDRAEYLKFDPTAVHGLCVGYHMEPGYRWSGDYYVLNLETLRTSNLATDKIRTRRVKEIELIYPVRFPLREIIERRRILLEKSSLDAPLDDERGVMGLDSQRLGEDESASGTTSDAHTQTDASSMEDLDVMSDFRSDIPSDSANTT